MSEPVNVYEVIGTRPAAHAAADVGAARAVASSSAASARLEQMKRALERAKGGHGQIVAAMGEAGVGKSRLFFEFKARRQSGCLVLEALSVSHGKASAYLPMIDLLKDYFDLIPEDDERRRREKITGKVLMLDRALEDTLPIRLRPARGGGDGERCSGRWTADLRRRRTLDAIKRLLLRESLNQPLIVIFEDLHWIDEETQALLNLLAESIGTAQILMLVNYRPEYSHNWGNKTYYTQLRLDPLGAESAEEMLTALLSDALRTGGRSSALIIEKTEGNPFFMEEIVQALFEQGVLVRNGAVKVTRSISDDSHPVHGTGNPGLAHRPAAAGEKGPAADARGDRQGIPAGAASSRCRQKPDDELERMLSALQLGEFIYEQPAFPETEYIFKHALTQEVAYGSLLVERRKEIARTYGSSDRSSLQFATGRPLRRSGSSLQLQRKQSEGAGIPATCRATSYRTIRKHGSDKSPHCRSAPLEHFAGYSAARSAGIGPTDDAWSGSDSDEGQRRPGSRSRLQASAAVGSAIRRRCSALSSVVWAKIISSRTWRVAASI